MSEIIETYTGYIIDEGVRVQVDFEVRKNSTKEQKDAAFLDNLAQIIHLNYFAIGECERGVVCG